MSGQMTLGVCLLITGHAILHYRSELKWRVASAWLMTGAFFLACGVAVPEQIRSQKLSNQIDALHASGHASQIAVEAETESPTWTVDTPDGIFSFIEPEKRVVAWPASKNKSW